MPQQPSSMASKIKKWIKRTESEAYSTDASIRRAQSAFTPAAGQDLAYIKSNFSVFIPSITKLESQGLSINECAFILFDVRSALADAGGEIGEAILEKFQLVLKNNPGLETIKNIGKILDGDKIDDFDMPPNLIPFYKYAPLVSVDVERSFSIYKTILADNRTSFTPEHLEKQVICNCEHFYANQ